MGAEPRGPSESSPQAIAPRQESEESSPQAHAKRRGSAESQPQAIAQRQQSPHNQCMPPLGYALLGALALINLLAFGAFGLDKWRAKKGARRTPEKTLTLFAVAGGWIGTGAGLKLFRHKSSKRSFQVKLAAGTLANLALWVVAWRLGWLASLV